MRTAEDGTSARSPSSIARHYDLVISDLKMPQDGRHRAARRRSARHTPNALTVIMTGFGTVETAIDAMKRGAYDYILKPFKVEEVVHIVQRGLEKQRLAAENMRLSEALSLYKVSEAIAASLSLDEVIAHRRPTRALDEVDADVVIDLARRRRGRLLRAQRASSARNCRGERASSASSTRDALRERLQRRARRCVEHGARALRASSREQPERAVSSRWSSCRCSMRSGSIGWIARRLASPRASASTKASASCSASSPRAPPPRSRTRGSTRISRPRSSRRSRASRSAIDKMDRYTAGHSERVARYAHVPRDAGSGSARATDRDRPPVGADARHRQDRLRDEPEQARQAHAGRVRDLQEAPGLRPRHPRADQASCTRSSPACTCTTSAGTAAATRSGCKGNDIPLIARIISVADTYDAMTSDRAYRRALPHEVAVERDRALLGHAVRSRGRRRVHRAASTSCATQLRDSGEHVPE